MDPTGDHAMVGDGRSTALISRSGTVDWLCWPRFDSPSMFGSLLDDRAGCWRIHPAAAFQSEQQLIGFLVHLVNGGLFSLLYVAAFHAWDRATWWLGAFIGFVHVAFVLTAGMRILPGLHPRMASEQHGPSVTRQLEPPGFLALHYGIQTPLLALLAHLCFGAIIGGFYDLPPH